MQNPLPIPSQAYPSVQLDAIRFEGKKKKKQKTRPLAAENEKLERQLLKAGVNGEVLWKQFRVKLWTVRQLDGKALLKIDSSANKDFKEKALVHFLEDKLKQPVTIKDKRLKSCCEKQCKGCLADRPDKQQTWRLNRFA